MAEMNFEGMKVSVGGLRGAALQHPSSSKAAAPAAPAPPAPAATTPMKGGKASVTKKPAGKQKTKGMAALILTMVEKEKNLRGLMSQVQMGST